MNIKLSGKTQKGKNRVREHGRDWHVLRECDRVIFSPEPGPWGFIAPVGKGREDNGSRWVNLRDDKDFNIESSEG